MGTNEYEYRCNKCGLEGHFLDFIGRNDESKCRACGSDDIVSLVDLDDERLSEFLWVTGQSL